MSSNMLVYTVKDHTGEETTHLAISKESAIQAHLIHFSLLYLLSVPEVSEGILLSKIKDRKTICWDPNCCIVGATDYNKYDSWVG